MRPLSPPRPRGLKEQVTMWNHGRGQALTWAVALMLTGTLAPYVAADAPPGHYSIDSGVVTDNATGLHWQQGPGQSGSWTDAMTFCQQLDLSGTGWRLPSVKELQTLVDRTRSDPAIEPGSFPDTPSEPFWTSTPVVGDSTSAWDVSFKSGASAGSPLTSTARIRCVR